MVAYASDHNFLNFRNTDIFNEWLRTGPIYIYFILMNREKVLETIIVLALATLIASLLLDIDWLIYIATGLLTISIISKWLTNMIAKAWLSFSNHFGVIMNYIIMFVIFYFFLFPLSFFQRLFNKNQIFKKQAGNSHFIQRNHLYTNRDVENPW